eukprot:TRINITY_DN37665_c0_g1_i1.p1 TRINITY_DN37665_c0_g1~~TRINITY_DN37665_c0_g1_i1.p1  ORF type:complete len:162 (+),score=26.33 TRINITY_DN37665_c0_g1_i1:32-487(+)
MAAASAITRCCRWHLPGAGLLQLPRAAGDCYVASQPRPLLVPAPDDVQRSKVFPEALGQVELLDPPELTQEAIIAKDPEQRRLRKWSKRWTKVRESFNKKGGGYARPFHWPSDHLDRGVGTPGWDRSGASGPERGALRAFCLLPGMGKKKR